MYLFSYLLTTTTERYNDILVFFFCDTPSRAFQVKSTVIDSNSFRILSQWLYIRNNIFVACSPARKPKVFYLPRRRRIRRNDAACMNRSCCPFFTAVCKCHHPCLVLLVFIYSFNQRTWSLWGPEEVTLPQDSNNNNSEPCGHRYMKIVRNICTSNYKTYIQCRRKSIPWWWRIMFAAVYSLLHFLLSIKVLQACNCSYMDKVLQSNSFCKNLKKENQRSKCHRV